MKKTGRKTMYQGKAVSFFIDAINKDFLTWGNFNFAVTRTNQLLQNPNFNKIPLFPVFLMQYGLNQFSYRIPGSFQASKENGWDISFVWSAKRMD